MEKPSFKFLFLLIAFLGFGMSSAHSQDLLARQAPIDKKLKSIDSLVLQEQITSRSEEFPALSLYPEWITSSVHCYANVVIPDSYTIDLTDFVMPTDSRKVTSGFGARWGRRHNGLDIKVNIGDTIKVAFAGKVRIVKNEPRGYGRYIVVRHYNGLETIYGHLSKQLVKPGDDIEAGDVIGLGGNTGRSYGSHLHFETRFLGIAIDPSQMFDFPNQDVVADTFVFEKKKGDNSTASAGGAYYRVRHGDTLTGIAASKRISVDTICKLNSMKQDAVLHAGQQLRLY
ncbi:Peptidase M23 [Bacteroides coprosuis DSM 18011]|uniref:Peptidase M23 n=2 Tax=Bacteroides TaxID=816 RepID=F3ZPK3_9BACE|nr:Peptidase M23 [Bacteroides coprosuis DSM 18011]